METVQSKGIESINQISGIQNPSPLPSLPPSKITSVDGRVWNQKISTEERFFYRCIQVSYNGKYIFYMPFIESKNTSLNCIVFGLGRCTWTWGVLNKTLVFTSETRRSYQQHFMPSWRSWCREFHAKFKAGYDVKIVTVLDYTFLREIPLL